MQNSAQQSFFAFVGLFADGKGAESSLFKVAAVQLLHQFDEREGILCAGGLVAGVHRQLGQADVHAAAKTRWDAPSPSLP